MNHLLVLFLLTFQLSMTVASDKQGPVSHFLKISETGALAQYIKTKDIYVRKNIYVTGIVINIDNQQRNGAIFNINGNHQYVREGELIDNRIVLDKVEAGFVKVTYLYTSELIKLSGDRDKEKVDDPDIPGLDTAEHKSTLPMVYQSFNTVSKNDIKAYFESVDAFDKATFTPFPEGGFLISEIQPDSIFTALGFKKWDVISAANEKALNTLEDVLWLKEQVLKGSPVTLKIREYGDRDFVLREYYFQ